MMRSPSSAHSQTSLIVEVPCFKNDIYWNYNNNKIVSEVQNKLIEIVFTTLTGGGISYDITKLPFIRGSNS